MAAVEERPDVASVDLGDHFDNATFDQILEMDEGDSTREFSKSLFVGYFEQAEQTFDEMDEALANEDLASLSDRGHYLKGSSATLGLVRVKDSCEKIQRYGKMENLDGGPLNDEKACLKLITDALEDAKLEYAEAERILRKFFGMPMESPEEDSEDDDEEGDDEEGEGEKEVKKENKTEETKDAKNAAKQKDEKANSKPAPEAPRAPTGTVKS